MQPRPAAITSLLIGITSLGVQAQPQSVVPGEPRKSTQLPDIQVLGGTPLSSTGLESKKVPGNFQSADSEDLYRHENLDLTDFLKRNGQSIFVNEVLNNSFQPDVSYRGFSASPVLGTPIRLSVYQDGVRINEPFGDTVQWDLIPRSAIDRIEVVPESNPLFGLNTLGGALSIRTKNGFTHPGTRGQAYGGSFGRKAVELQHGGNWNNFDWFPTSNLFEEDGWRDFSPFCPMKFCSRMPPEP